MAIATETDKVSEKAAADQKPLFAENGLGMGEFLKPTTEEKDSVPAPAPLADSPPEAKSAPEETKKNAAKEPATTEPVPTSETDAQKLVKLEKDLRNSREGFSVERKNNKALETKITGLEQSIQILTKKIDGTYDEAKDAPRVLTSQEIETEAETRATVRTSHFAAVEYLMARDKLTETEADAKVKELVWSEDAPFRAFDTDRSVQARVLGAKVPIIEALKVVQEAEDKKKYGDSPQAMREALKKELTEQIETKVREKLLKELKGKGVPMEELKGLGGVQSVSPERAPQTEPRVTLESLFPNFKGAGS